MVQRESSATAGVRVPAPAPSGPVRTCVGCRQRAVTVDLLRVVARPVPAGATPAFAVVPDIRRRLDGRGAWLHPERSCLEQAQRRRAFGRALRITGVVHLEELTEVVERGATSGGGASETA